MIDIIIGILLIIFAITGLVRGLIKEVFGLLAVFLALYIALYFSSWLSNYIHIASKYAHIIYLITTFVLVLFASFLVTKITDLIVTKIGLGVFNKLFGAIFAALKGVLIIGVLIYFYEKIDVTNKLTDEQSRNKSIFYKPIKNINTAIFPHIKGYLTTGSEMVEDAVDQIKQNDSIQ